MIVTLNLSPVETVGVFHCNLVPRLHAYLSSDCSSIDFLCANWWPIRSAYWPGSCQSISVDGWWVGFNYSEVDWQCIGSAFVFQLKCSSVIAMCGLCIWPPSRHFSRVPIVHLFPGYLRNCPPIGLGLALLVSIDRQWNLCCQHCERCGGSFHGLKYKLIDGLNRPPLRLIVGPHSTLVPRLLAQLSSDWCRIDIELVTDWHDIWTYANWCQLSLVN